MKRLLAINLLILCLLAQNCTIHRISHNSLYYNSKDIRHVPKNIVKVIIEKVPESFWNDTICCFLVYDNDITENRYYLINNEMVLGFKKEEIQNNEDLKISMIKSSFFERDAILINDIKKKGFDITEKSPNIDCNDCSIIIAHVFKRKHERWHKIKAIFYGYDFPF